MTPNQTDAYKYLGLAQQARKAGDKRLARQHAEQAARLAPELEDVWLMMGALASPRASVVFMEKALQINPDSERVRQGLHWAVERLKNAPPPKPVPLGPAPSPDPDSAPKTAGKPRIPLMMIMLAAMCLVVLVSAVWAAPSMAAAFINSTAGNQNTPAWAVAEIAKPTYNIAAASETAATTNTAAPAKRATSTLAATETMADLPPVADTSTPAPTATEAATATPTSIPTQTPTARPTEVASPTSLDSDNSAHPSPTALPTDTAIPYATLAPQATRYVPTPGSNGNGNGGRWIDVDLTHQMTYAYEGNTIVNSFLVSTGTWQHPTVTGQYHIYIKYRYARMTGPGYDLPNVPYTMYFYQSYALHGTYWHSNFGTPMSHGCVNLSIPDSEWLYNWASVGTLVNVHY